jgi:tryptophan synthase alpha chain
LSRINAKFKELRHEGKGALIAFITAGDTSPKLTPNIATALAEHADILELGIPFSDPIADGPTIQAADDRALSAGTTPETVFKIIRDIRKRSDIPIVVLSYYNIVLNPGVENFMKKLKTAGGDGIIIPDLPLEESKEALRAAKNHGISMILLATPTTTPERLKQICRASSGFLYLVSVLGVTGARRKLSKEVKDLVKKARAASMGRIPIAIGFGISKPRHVREVLKLGADAAIVGSAFVDLIARHKNNKRRMLNELDHFAKSLKAAC